MIPTCLSKNCFSVQAPGSKFCTTCLRAIGSHLPNHPPIAQQAKEMIKNLPVPPAPERSPGRRASDRPPESIPMSEKYPKYYKRVPDDVKELDIYAVCQMFPVEDPTGCINHARKKLLIPGTRTGGKSMYSDIKEARDTLNRWLELNVPDDDLNIKVTIRT